jgi:hypothetical protein
LQKYIIQNEMADTYKSSTDANKQYLLDRALGGARKGFKGGGGTTRCANTKLNDGIHKWTMQKYTDNQRSFSKELRGGRVSLPIEYFGTNTGRYVDTVKMSKMSDITQQTARPGMVAKLTGGGDKHTHKHTHKNIFTKKDLDVISGGKFQALKLSNNQQNELLRNYNTNMKSFMKEVHDITSKGGNGGGGQPTTKGINMGITKRSIDAAYRNMKHRLN